LSGLDNNARKQAPLAQIFDQGERRMITVHVEPGRETHTFARHNTVLMLQKQLGLRVNDAIIIRGEKLLTPDCRLEDGDEILVRKVTSTG
jgi:sulfur carrier protein